MPENKPPQKGKNVVARRAWLETHFTFVCPNCEQENESVALGSPTATVGRCCKCGQVVHIRQAMPKVGTRPVAG